MIFYNIVSETGYALSVNPNDQIGQLVLAEVNSASNLQLWRVSYWWSPNDKDRRTFMTLVNYATGLAATADGRGDSSPVKQSSINELPLSDSSTWVFDRVKSGSVPIGTLTAGYDSHCYPDGDHWCQVMNAQGDHYYPGVKIITYHLDNSYTKNCLWAFHPKLF